MRSLCTIACCMHPLSSAYHTLGHLSLASLLDLSTLSSFQLILAHFESVGGHTCTVSYMPNTKTSPHYSCHLTYIRAVTTCNDIQNIWYARIQHDDIHTWYNNTEVPVARVSRITKAVKAKKYMPCGAIYTTVPLMHTNVSSTSHTKRQRVNQSGENLVCSLYVLLCVAWTAWLLIMYILSSVHSSPPLSRDHDHRFSSLMRPAVLLLLFLRCLPVLILQRVGFVILLQAASSDILLHERDFQHDKIELNCCHGTFFDIP